MKNRAKCKLCKSIIESLHNTDYVHCACSHIAVYGGPGLMQCSAVDWANFLRVDDLGNEVVITVKGDNSKPEELTSKPEGKELLYMLDEMISSIDKLPERAKTGYITQTDFQTLLMLLSAYFKLNQA